MSEQLFGWIVPEERTREQHEAHEQALAFALPFALEGTYHEVNDRFPLWKALQDVLGKPGDQVLPYNWQVTGSCVGAGGGNMLKTLMAVEIKQGDLEEWKHIWWPYTYGRSRFRAGMRSPGEGSLGSSWAEAITKDGIFGVHQKSGLPEFRLAEGWLQLDRSTEIKWSDGDASHVEECATLAKEHLVKAYAQIRESSEGKAALANGYAMTCASNFGTRGPRRKGSPEVNIAEWDATWPHQMFIDEAWDHPTEGLLFRIGNNWGPGAHPAPTQQEPRGGFYVTAKTFDRICAAREVFAFSFFSGFKARKLDWFI